MQTFLPYDNYLKSMIVLDNKRLNKQVLETHQIIHTLTYGSRWENHPAVIMWQGHLDALKAYFNAALEEWLTRGFNSKFVKYEDIPATHPYPWWMGLTEFHLSHRSNLKRKDPGYYKEFDIGTNWVYLWPLPEKGLVRVVTPSWWKKLPQQDRPELYIPESGNYNITEIKR